MAFNKEKVMDAARKFVDKGQVDKAIKEYLRVVKEDPQDVRVWLKIGDLYAKKGSKQEATETYLKVARYYQDQGFFLKAVAVFKQILKLDPRLVEVNLKLAELYRQLGLLSDAMQHFESVAAHFHREGKTKEALATVRQLVDLDPENIATRIKLAELYSKEQMTAEAVVEFQVACDQLRKQNRVEDFVKVAERLLWHKADNLPLNRELSQLYLRRGDPRRALQKLQVSFKADPRDVDTLALLAQAFQALDQKSKTVSVLKELARVFDENKQRDKAEDVHRKILQFVPNDADSLAYLGDKARAPAGERPAFKPVVTPPPPMEAPRNPRLNLTSEVAAMQDPRMTGSMPLVDSPEFSLPDYEEPPAAEAEVGDFSEELSLDDGYAAARSSSHAGEEHADEINKILTETDVYIKYGLHQKAIDHLRRVFALDAENLEARERLKDVLQSQGREREAIAELMRLAESTAAADPDRAEGYLREVLALDGTYRPAFDLARRFKLDLAAERPAGSEGEIDLDSGALAAGGVAPIDDDLDFDDIDFGEASGGRRAAVGVQRADSFDGIDPAIFHGQHGVGHAQLGNARPAASASETTRQIAASEVEALAAMSSAPRSLEFEDGVVETPVPQLVRGAAWQAPRSLDDVLDEQLDDALGEDIDQDVAAELSGAIHVGANDEYEVAPASEEYDADDFDPAEARAFDIGLGKRPPPRDGFAEVPQTFDPAAAAAFDADRPAGVYATPSAADLGAAPADFDTMGLGPEASGEFPPPSQYDDDAAVDPDADLDEPSSTIDVPPDQLAALAQSYDGGYTVDAPLVDDSFDPNRSAGYEGGTVDAPYEEPYQDADEYPEQDGGLEVQEHDVQEESIDVAASGDRVASLEDDLDEVDFYVSQDMLVEASDILRALLARHPNHPLVEAKLRDVEAAAGGYVADGFQDRGAQVAAEVDVDAVEEELDAELDADVDSAPVAASGGTQNIDLEELEELVPDELEELAEDEPMLDEPVPDSVDIPIAASGGRPSVMLEKPVEEGDAETHFDLGLAYKEMGLFDEAVKAFSKLKHHPVRSVQARIMIGLCQREQGNFSEAIQQFKAGLHTAQVNDREKQSLYYEIGVAYESMGDVREALYYFDTVTKRDPNYLDVAARLARLRGASSGRHAASDDSEELLDDIG